MPIRGRNISVFLMDGEASGKIKVSISNWNGVAYKIPRKLLNDCREFEAFSRSGVYFLFGVNNVYVGQAEVRSNGGALYRRVFEHTTDRLSEAWDEVVIFTTRDNTLGRTDISFLENYFYEQAIRVNRYIVLNNNTPSPSTVTEEKRSELEEYADSAELILGVLGYKVFEPAEDAYVPVPTAVPVPIAPLVTTLRQPVPALPDASLKVGEYVYKALQNLGESGYVFTEEAIDKMCTSEWSTEVFHTNKPFMKRYIPGQSDNKGADGRIRFKSEPFTFGGVQVYISKEWFERQRGFFETWYQGL